MENKIRISLYEGMFIFNTILSQDAMVKSLQRIEDCIVRLGGEVKQKIDMEKRKLAYKLNKHSEGHYYLLYFNIPNSAVIDLKKELKLNEDLLRFMIVKAEEVLEKLEFKQLNQE